MHDILICLAFFAIVFAPCAIASRSNRERTQD
jgi:hypothetical protein